MADLDNPDDIARVKRNITRMIDAKAPESDIDLYLKGENVAADDLKYDPATSRKLATTTASLTGAKRERSYGDLAADYATMSKHVGPETAQAYLSRWGVTPDDLAAARPARGITHKVADAARFGADLTRQGLQGATLGHLDEGLAAVNAATQGKSYRDALGEQRAQDEGFQNENPALALAAQIGGGFAMPGVGPAMQWANAAKSVPGMVGRAAATGGALGAGQGAGTAATAEEIPERMLEGGGIGTAFGIGVPAIATGAKRAAEFVKAPAADRAADKIMRQRLDRDAMHPYQVTAARTRTGGDQTALADVAGENLQAAFGVAASMPGPGKQTISKFLADRAATEATEATGAIKRNVSTEDFFRQMDAVKARRASEADTLYTAAGIPRDPKQFPKAKVLQGGQVTQFVEENPMLKGAIAQAQRIGEYRKLDPNSIVVWDKAYHRLSDGARSAERSGQMEKVRDIKALQARMRSLMDWQSRGYSAAVGQYADESALMRAGDFGRDMIRRNMPASQAAKQFRALDPDEQQLALAGVAEELRMKIMNAPTASARNAVLGARADVASEDLARLKFILPRDDFNDLKATLDRLEAYRTTQARVGVRSGSRTAPLAAEMADSADAANIAGRAVQAATGNPISALLGAGVDRIRQRAGGFNEATNAELARRATITDPNEIRALMYRLANQQPKFTFGNLALPGAIGGTNAYIREGQ